MRAPDAYLFDMDGTLCHTEPLHYAAVGQIMAENGQTLDPRFYTTQLAGQTTPVVFSLLFPEASDIKRQRLIERKEVLFRELARNLLPTPGVVAFLDDLTEVKAPVALVTNAPRVDVDFILEVLGMSDRFNIKIVATELPHPKPHPMPYLRGLDACGVSARFAVAFEDSLTGVSSATTAGIKTVGVTTTLSGDALLRAGASLTIADFRDARLRKLSVAAG